MPLAVLILGVWPVLASPPAPAEPPDELQFVRLGPEQGLAHNTSTSIIQDRQGFIWITTDDGLNRYDGYEFKHFRLDPGLGRSNVFKELCEDAQGDLWVGSRGGLLRFDRSNETLEMVDLELPESAAPDTEVRAIQEDANGWLWVAVGSEIFLRERAEESFRHIGSVAADPGEDVELVLALRPIDDGAWVLSGDRLTRMVALSRLGSDGTVERHAHPEPRARGRSFFVDRLGKFWIAAARWGSMVDQVTDEFPSGIPASAAVEVIRRSEDGSLWMGTSEGLFRLRPDGGSLEHFPLGESFQEQYVTDLIFDRAGSLWVTTLAGVLRHDPGMRPFTYIGEGGNDRFSLSSGAVSDVVGDEDGFLWVGTFGGGLNRVDRRTGQVDRYRNDPSDPGSLCDDVVWDVHLDGSGTLWVGTSTGVCLLDRRTGRFRPLSNPLLPDGLANVRRVDDGPGGTVWVGLSTGGLFEVDGETLEWRSLAREESNLMALEVVSETEAWAGYYTGVLVRINPSSGATERYELVGSDGARLAYSGIYDIWRDSEGSLWLASDSGLMRFWPDSGRVDLGIAADELPGTVCFSIVGDDRGRLWIGTNQGLARFDPTAPAGERVRVFALADGVGNIEFNRGAIHKSPSGEMFFGGMTGLTIFQPDRVDTNPPAPPPVVLTDISVQGDGGERQVGPWRLERVTLGPGDYSVSFQFSALDFILPSRNRYAFKLEGLDPDWVESGTRRFARYTRLPPRSYTFRVKASSGFGDWHEAGVSLPVTVMPPFWQTWGFRLAVFALVATLLYLAHRLRLRRLLELERMRLRIATDLHDELGGELSSIALSSAMARRKEYLEEPERRRLEEIEASSHKVASSLRDIIWYINPEHDSLPTLVQRMRGTATQLLGDLDWTFEGDDAATAGAMTMVARRDLYLIFKEALTNVIRHAEAEKVAVRLELRGNQLRLEIEDDGVGFEEGRAGEGKGIGNMRRRAERVGGALKVASSPGGGTRISLEYPLASSRGGG